MRIFPFFIALILLSSSVLPAPDAAGAKALDLDVLDGLRFRSIGPAFMSGRIADLAIDPQNRDIWYVAVGSGGVWKTENGGTTFRPVFDDQNVYSIGCIAVDPSDSQVIWVGSGENVSGRHVGYGDGVYRSSDGGRTWQNMGLKSSEHIDKILIHPRDSQTVYVAAEGPLWSSGGERGVYKSTDGGKNWQPILTVDADTGATDLVMHPQNPDILYAATHQRRRHVSALINGGPGSGIHKSVDGGKSWTLLKKGLPDGDLGQIALAISPQRPQVVYASVETSIRTITFFRSEDGGSSWHKGASYVTPGTGPHYYQELYASPHQFDRIYSMEINILVSNDGGRNWGKIPEDAKHGDNHALAFVADDPDYLLCGSDGGLYETRDGGRNWRYMSNLPVTQFYRIAVDNEQPFYNIVGGTQDNCTQYGPSQSLRREGVFGTDWKVIMGGDGYTCQIDPQDPDTIYCEAQVGEMTRYNRRSGESVLIKPFVGPREDIPRWNWDSPLIISPFDSRRLYFASQRLYRSDDRGDSWRAISPDLSRGQNRLSEKFMGRSWSVNAVWDNDAMSYYGNVVTVTESPLQEGLLYCGTDDGLIQISENGGSSWTRLSRFPGVPEGTFVVELMASRHERDTVFALFNNHQRGDFTPYLLKSTDRGKTWHSLTAGIPKRHVLWTIEQDHIQKDLLFLGSEFGVFTSVDGGASWQRLKGGMPTISVRDIRIQTAENDLVCATFGRGIYILDDYSSLRELAVTRSKTPFHLFAIREGKLYSPLSTLGGGQKGTQGHSFYTADNAPFGVQFTFYLAESEKSLKDKRRQEEMKLEKAGKDVPFPGWDRLQTEGREIPPRLEWLIEDADGEVVRRLDSAPQKGISRLVWDMRLASQRPVRSRPPVDDPFSYGMYGEGRGPLVLPGDYFVSVFMVSGASRTLLCEKKPFRCRYIGPDPLSSENLARLKQYQKKAMALNLEVSAFSEILGRFVNDLEILRRSLPRATGNRDSLLAELLRVQNRVLDLNQYLEGDELRSALAEPRHSGLLDRVWLVVGRSGAEWSPLTQTQSELLEHVTGEVRDFRKSVQEIMEKDVPKLMALAQSAGCPWVPGFGLYDVK